MKAPLKIPPTSGMIRWRAFKIGEASAVFPFGEFAEVWDTTARPFEKTGDIPSGPKVAEVADYAFDHLLWKVKEARCTVRIEAPTVWIEPALAEPDIAHAVLA